MTSSTEIVPAADIAPLIRFVRETRVILDSDLAGIYGVQTRVLNQAFKRNQERFPDDFAFLLSLDEILGISQSVISLRRLKFSKQVRAFTEHGALMAANILNSPRAVAMSVYVIRAFVKIREDLVANAGILKRLAEIDKTLLLHDSLFPLSLATIKGTFTRCFPGITVTEFGMEWRVSDGFFQVSFIFDDCNQPKSVCISSEYSLVETPEIFDRIIAAARDLGCTRIESTLK